MLCRNRWLEVDLKTQALVVASETGRSYRSTGFGIQNYSETAVEHGVRRKGIFRPDRSPVTVAVPVDEEARSFRLVASDRPVQGESRELRKSVDGVVGKYDDVSVTCVLHLGGREVSIQLPPPLFPDEIRYGLPINVELAEVGGIRKPVISVRQIDARGTADIAAEFDAILAQLD